MFVSQTQKYFLATSSFSRFSLSFQSAFKLKTRFFDFQVHFLRCLFFFEIKHYCKMLCIRRLSKIIHLHLCSRSHTLTQTHSRTHSLTLAQTTHFCFVPLSLTLSLSLSLKHSLSLSLSHFLSLSPTHTLSWQNVWMNSLARMLEKQRLGKFLVCLNFQIFYNSSSNKVH